MVQKVAFTKAKAKVNLTKVAMTFGDNFTRLWRQAIRQSLEFWCIKNRADYREHCRGLKNNSDYIPHNTNNTNMNLKHSKKYKLIAGGDLMKSTAIRMAMLLLAALLCAALLAACSSDEGVADEVEAEGIAVATDLIITAEMLTHSEFAAVTLEIVEGTLTTTGASFALRNNTSYAMTYGQFFQLRVWDGARWAFIPMVPPGAHFTDEGLFLAPYETQLIMREWGLFHGELPPGIYRFHTHVGNEDIGGNVYVVFVIEYNENEYEE